MAGNNSTSRSRADAQISRAQPPGDLAALTAFEWSRPRELRWIDGDVGPQRFQCKSILSIGPRHDDPKRQLDARDLAVIGVVNLRGDGTHGSFVPAHEPH